MPVSGYDQSSSSSKAAYVPLQPRVEVRLNMLRKALRFLGIDQVRVMHEATPKLPAREQGQEPAIQKELSDWDISATEPVSNIRATFGEARLGFSEVEAPNIWNDMNQRYLGFRANSKNLNRLYHDIVGSKVSLQPNESEKDYRQRVALTLVASGLSGMADGAPRGLHTLNRPLTRHQLMRLEENLDRPLHEVVLEVNKGKSKVKSRLDREIDSYPKLVMEVCSRMPLEDKDSLRFVSRHSCYYLTSGEGLEVLKEHGFPDAVDERLGNIFPVLHPDRISSDVMVQAKKYQRTNLKSDATDSAGNTISGIKYGLDKSEQAFNPESPEHRCLVMLQNQATCWLGYCEGRIQAGLNNQNNEDESTAKGLIEAKRILNDYWLAMSHRIMLGSKEFSTNFDSKNYQQVVLRRSDDQVVCWNSDSVQPRGGWFDGRRSDPVTLPK